MTNPRVASTSVGRGPSVGAFGSFFGRSDVRTACVIRQHGSQLFVELNGGPGRAVRAWPQISEGLGRVDGRERVMPCFEAETRAWDSSGQHTRGRLSGRPRGPWRLPRPRR